jgi:hypothetical protein
MISAKEKAYRLVAEFARIDGYDDSIDLSTCHLEKEYAILTVLEIVDALVANDADYDSTYWDDVMNEIEAL